MSGSLTDKTLRAAHEAARLLHGNHRAPGSDPDAIKPGTLRADITTKHGNRGKPARPAVGGTPAGA
jgi:hypothetical protein